MWCEPPRVYPVGERILDFLYGYKKPRHRLLRLICERIKYAAEIINLTKEEINLIFGNLTIFSAGSCIEQDGKNYNFIIFQAWHEVYGKVGKGALKLIFPQDLPQECEEPNHIIEESPNVIKIVSDNTGNKLNSLLEGREFVRGFLEEWVVGETLSMDLKCMATGTPFSGSEGVIICAEEQFDKESGAYYLKSCPLDNENNITSFRELLNGIMNKTSEILTDYNRIAHDKVVHAAETNSTITARYGLELPTNVVEGHLRSLLSRDVNLIIGDEDMTRRLRTILTGSDYKATDCRLAKDAARIEMEHSIISLASRERLRNLLLKLPQEGYPKPEQFYELTDIFFGTGEIQQTEDQLFNHRGKILQELANIFSINSLESSENSNVLIMFLRILLDNQEKMMKDILIKNLQPGETLLINWFREYPLFEEDDEKALHSLIFELLNKLTDCKTAYKRILDILTNARQRIVRSINNIYQQARIQVIEEAISTLVSASRIVPPVERIRFFTRPFTYECVTPKLGVVTRKPTEIFGSELRPEAMAYAAMYSIKHYLQKFYGTKEKPFKSMKVAIQGLGNAGKVFVSLMINKNANVVGISDSSGALIAAAGFTPEEIESIINHKNSGKRLSSYPIPEEYIKTGAIVFHNDPDVLLGLKADLLVLTAKAGSINGTNVNLVKSKIICELTGGAISLDAKKVLNQIGCAIIPDNLASSGGLLVSLFEMLQNSAGQHWERRLEETLLNDEIYKSLIHINKTSEKWRATFSDASDILALQRLLENAIYENNLKIAAEKIRRKLVDIEENEVIILACDNDEDGVASSAIMHNIITYLNPRCEKQIMHLVESLRSVVILKIIEKLENEGKIIKSVFFLDRALPSTQYGIGVVESLVKKCNLIIINNHEIPKLEPQLNKYIMRLDQSKPEEDQRLLLISPQTLKSPVPAKRITSSLVMKELASVIVKDSHKRLKIDWLAGIGSCLDISQESNNEWSLFYAQFNPDQMIEAAKAVRMVSRARSIRIAIDALLSIENPDRLELSKEWETFMNLYNKLETHIKLLVEIITLENVGKPYVSHFFTDFELIPNELPLNEENERLDLYHWISEYLTKRSDFSEKPIIVGQIVKPTYENPYLAIRIRSPKNVDLTDVGLPENFKTGGLPNTAIGIFALSPAQEPIDQFNKIVEEIWWKTVSPTVRVKARNTKSF
ncbi:MAG: hypothetical protein ACPMAG_03320 [Limisphaerales bacterium]